MLHNFIDFLPEPHRKICRKRGDGKGYRVLGGSLMAPLDGAEWLSWWLS